MKRIGEGRGRWVEVRKYGMRRKIWRGQVERSRERRGRKFERRIWFWCRENSIAFPPRLWINSGETSFRIYYSPFVECIFTRNKLPVRFWNKVSLASLIAAITKLFSQILRRLKKLNFPFIKRTDSLLPHINSSFSSSSSSSSLFFRKIHNSFALVWNFAVEEKQFQ